MLQPADPDLLAVDHITVALFHGGGLQLGGIGASCRFSHRHGLQPQFARGDARQVLLLLHIRTMSKQSTHIVHLTVAMASVAA